MPKAGLYQRGLPKVFMDRVISFPILEIRSKTLRRPLSLLIGFPTGLLDSLSPETSLRTKWWVYSGNPTPS